MEQNEKVQIPCWNVCTHLRNSIPEKENSLKQKERTSENVHRVGEWTQWGDKRSKSFVAAITAEKGKETLLKPSNTGHIRHTYYYLGIRDILSSLLVLQHQQKSIVKRHIDVDLQAINTS